LDVVNHHEQLAYSLHDSSQLTQAPAVDLHEGVAVLDHDLRLVMWNPCFEVEIIDDGKGLNREDLIKTGHRDGLEMHERVRSLEASCCSKAHPVTVQLSESNYG
jgi:hypothetical protein